MSQKKLKTAILGLSEDGLDLLDAADRSDLFEIMAVADANIELAEKIAQRYDCQPFDDFRQLMVQNMAEVLLAASPIHLCDEYIRAALKAGVHVVKLSPPSLDFEHMAELMRTAKKNDANYFVAVLGCYSPGFNHLREYIRQQESVGRFHLVTANCFVPQQTEDPHSRWLGDPKLAGGGVLLQNCYALIDQIISYFGLPQQVYSLNTNQAPDKQQRLSITEDTAIVTMKFTDTLLANVIASRTFGPARQELVIHGADKNITADENSMIIRSNDGEIISEYAATASSTDAKQKMLEDFVERLTPSENESPAHDEVNDLNTIAVIESAYLSARTAMPEDPARLLSLVKA